MLVCHSQLIFNVQKVGDAKYFVYLQLNAGEPVVQLTSSSPTLFQWRGVTSETGHATGMPKTGHAIEYFMGS